MKLRWLLLTIIGTTVALFSGWLIDEREVASAENPLQVPDDIDYYLAGVSYQAFNTSGSTRFRLQTPYLEHFIREDASLLREPALHYYTPDELWRLSAGKGRLLHATEVFEFQQQAELKREAPAQPLSLRSNKFVFHSQQEVLNIPQPLELRSATVNLKAKSAVLDLGRRHQQYDGVKAIYQNRSQNVSG